MNKMKDLSILVTGGNGAVGCNLVKKLLDSNSKVTVLDDFSQSSPANLKKNSQLKIINGDINDEKILKKTFSTKYDYVFHLAARFANEMSVKNPYEDLKTNIEGTLRVLLYSAKQKIQRFLYTSSSSLYGPQKILPINENSIPNPSTPYAVSKYSGELYCNAVNHLYDLPFTIVRLSNSYGPFDPPGKFRNVIPNFFDLALKGKNLIITGSGKETRDFTFIDDTVEGIILAAFSKKGKNQTFNLGTGKETSISTIANLIIKITKSKSKITYKPLREFDHVKKRKMDISKSKKLLNYNPKTDLKIGLEKTFEWFTTN